MDTQFAELLRGAFKLASKLLHDSADAHDVIQDAATVAISHASAPNRQSQEFKPWFYKVVRNKSIDKLRGQQRDVKRNEEMHDSHSLVDSALSSNPEHNLAILQRRNKIDKALNEITLKHREIILLKDVHGFSYAQIASILDLADGSVMSRLHRARIALKQRIIALNEEDNSHV